MWTFFLLSSNKAKKRCVLIKQQHRSRIFFVNRKTKIRLIKITLEGFFLHAIFGEKKVVFPDGLLNHYFYHNKTKNIKKFFSSNKFLLMLLIFFVVVFGIKTNYLSNLTWSSTWLNSYPVFPTICCILKMKENWVILTLLKFKFG